MKFTTNTSKFTTKFTSNLPRNLPRIYHEIYHEIYTQIYFHRGTLLSIEPYFLSVLWHNTSTAQNMIYIFSVGNPGASSRHSVGHYVLQHLMHYVGAPQLVKKGQYSVARMATLTFVHSNSYMNDSGRLFAAFVAQERVNLNTALVYVLYDDFDLQLGAIKISSAGSSVSHNGIKSIRKHFPSMPSTVYKVAIGIGPKPNTASPETIANWVLAPFTSAQLETLHDLTMSKAEWVLDTICENDDGSVDIPSLNTQLR